MENNNKTKLTAFIWNTIASISFALQQLVFLVVLNRVVGVVESGILTIAYADGNLFLNIGKYGMRNFQASDVRRIYNFTDYYKSRVFSVIAMIIVSFSFVTIKYFFSGYDIYKSLVILFVCLFKVVDAIEDVYVGEMQRNNMLEVATKWQALRIITSVFLGIAIIIALKNLLYTFVIITLYSYCFFIVVRKKVFNMGRYAVKDKSIQLKQLLIDCFPLFLGAFLSFYIGNAPKYAIDRMMSNESQAVYGFISMPIFVIGLLNSFIFTPMITGLSSIWNLRNYKTFIIKVAKFILLLLIISVFVIAIGSFLGVPVLSIVYGIDLKPYQTELVLLLIGGSVLALSGLLNTLLTITRFQWGSILGYIIAAVLSFFMSNRLVGQFGMYGAAISYLVTMVSLCVIFSVVLVYSITKNKKDIGD